MSEESPLDVETDAPAEALDALEVEDDSGVGDAGIRSYAGGVDCN